MRASDIRRIRKGPGANMKDVWLAGAAVARRIHIGQAQLFPDPPKRDQFWLAMAIWA
jgi:predicted RNase H-like nuclease